MIWVLASGGGGAGELGGSEFLDACDGKPYTQLMKVIDEHMEALRVVQPKVYDATMQKIKELR